MPRELERAEAAGGEEVVRRQAESAMQHAVGLLVIRRVAGLARALLICEPEQIQSVHVLRLRPKRILQLQDQRGSVRGKSGRQPLAAVRRRGGDGGVRARGAEKPAEEK